MTDANFIWLKSTVLCLICQPNEPDRSSPGYKHVISEDPDNVTLTCGHIVSKEADYALRNISDRAIAWAHTAPSENEHPLIAARRKFLRDEFAKYRAWDKANGFEPRKLADLIF